MSPLYLGLDAGSVSVKIACVDADGALVRNEYVLHRGDPLGACRKLAAIAGSEPAVICATGSARKYIGKSCDAHLIKNEITALWRSVTGIYPHAGTIIEIGGQDSKLICLSNGEIESFKLNSVCAAGTGSFIQQQASRLNMSIDELSRQALSSERKARFSGRCTVFVETEMVNLQQRGFSIDAIAAGLSDAVCENYLKDLSPGMKLAAPYIFCGGVAAMDSVVRSFAGRLGEEPVRPDFYRVAGAYGAALLAKDFAETHTDTVPIPLTFHKTDAVNADSNRCTDCLQCGKCSET
jgi:predicted CoA-substrate-specific enzyme activase